MKRRAVGWTVAALSVLLLVLPATASAQPGVGPGHDVSAVFTMTNAPNGNEIVAYARSSSGTLSWVGNFATGGNGTGGSLADQGSLAITSDLRWLLAVDAGSNQVSVLSLGRSDGAVSLRLADVVSSGGVLPVSITTVGPLVYVLNDGNATVPGNIAGFVLSPSGRLLPIPGASEPLSTSAPTAAAEIAYDAAAGVLVVTEKNTNVLDVYPIGWFGRPLPPEVVSSQGSTPYGFAVTPSGAIVVSEAASGSLSSYRLGPNGWTVVSSSVPDDQGAPCWVAIAGGGQIAYTSNAHTNSISSYSVTGYGALALDQEFAAVTDATPTDLAVTPGGALLYVYDAGAHEIEGYAVAPNGSLTWVTTAGGLPASAEGLVAL